MHRNTAIAGVAIAGLFVLSVLVLVPTGVVAQSDGLYVGPHEPNNNRSSATPIDDGKIQGVVNYTGPDFGKDDPDVYSVIVEEGETITFLVTRPDIDATGLRISVFPPDAQEWEYDLIVSESGDTRAQYTFTAPVTGKYYIRLDKNVVGAKPAVPYTINITHQTGQTNVSSAVNATAGIQQETEPNDDYSAASPIREAQVTQVRGEIMVKGDGDWYFLNATEGENISIRMIKPADKSIVAMALYAPNGTEISNDTAFEGDPTAQITTTANQTGTYAVYIASDFTGVNIPYRLYIPASEAPDNVTLTATATETPATRTPAMGTETPTESAPVSTASTATGGVEPTETPAATATSPSEPAETPTITMVPTDTPSDSATNGGNASSGNGSGTNASDGTAAGGNGSGGSSTFGPGFGVIVAVIALLAAALLAVRQHK